MKLVLIIIVVIGSFGKIQTHKIPVKLIDYRNDITPAYCGYQTAYGILKLRLYKDFSPCKAGDTILIFQTCPRETMEREVKQYINDSNYELEIGNEISLPDLAKAHKLQKLNYPKDSSRKIYYGKLSK